MVRTRALVISSFAALALALGCSVSTTPPAPSNTPDGGGTTTKVKPETKPAVSSLKSDAGSTPPAGAQSKGVESNPTVGTIVLPIQNVDVYVFQMDADGDGTPDDISWAHVDGGSTFLWYQGPIKCSDGTVDDRDSFLMEVKPDGTGSYTFSLPDCPSGDLSGCDFDSDGNDTTCGACSIDGDDLVCVVSG